MPIEPVYIKLDRRRAIVLDMEALARAERELNKQRRDDGLFNISIFKVINDQVSGMSEMNIDVQVILILLWAGLLREDPALRLDAVGAMVRSPYRATGAVLKAIENYFRQETEDSDSEEGDGDKVPLDPSTGSH